MIAGGGVIALSVWAGLGGSMRAAPSFVPEPITCLPTCAIDSRSFVVAGDDNTTLAAQEISIGLNFTVASGELNLNFELYDGDRDPAAWDTPFNDGTPAADPPAPELIVELFVDPTGIGGQGAAIATWTPGAIPAGTEMGPFPTTNAGWAGVSLPHDPAALDGQGNRKYAIHVKPANPLVDKGWNAFKVRAAGTVQLLGNQVVGFIAAMNAGSNFDLTTVYPAFPVLTPTVYDGTWSFQTFLPPFLGDVTVFDGDMDFGNTPCAYNDTNDPDSDPANPNSAFFPTGIPPFAIGSAAVAEGVADAGLPCNPPNGNNRTGLPAEDNSGLAFQRVPTIVPNGIAYQLVAPDGQIFLNQNPTGNKEWEQFKIQKVNNAADIPGGIKCPVGGFAETPGFTLPDDPLDNLYPASDCRTTVMPGGIWEVQLDGMDLSNLNFWFFSFKVEPIVTEYSIGRRVWFDTNGDGNEDPGEPGANGVTYTVTVFDSPFGIPDGTVIRQGVTVPDGGDDGLISETGLAAGNYTVTVDATNFDPGGVLEGFTSTTGGEVVSGVEVGLPVCTDTNVPPGCGQPLHADAIFGYDQPGNVGVNAPTNTTCQDYVGGNIEEENSMFYMPSGNKIGNVAPGVIFFYTTVTVGQGQALSVSQSHTGTGAGVMLLHGNQGKVYTMNCQNVLGSATQNQTTGEVFFGALAPGTYVVQLKWSPKSLTGKPLPNPATIFYTFVAELNGVPQPITQNDPALALRPK